MFAYYVSLAVQSFRRQPWYGLLIALILGAGVGVFMTTYSLLYALGGDPIPTKSERLLSVRMGRTIDGGGISPRMSSAALQALREVLSDARLVATTNGFSSVESDVGDHREAELVRFADSGFFEMFDVPIERGRGWSKDEEINGSPVAVIGQDLAISLFGTASVLGRSVVVDSVHFRVVGVIGEWNPVPRFYDLSAGAYAPAEQLYLPLHSVSLMNNDMFIARECPVSKGSVSPRKLDVSSCSWLSVWTWVNDSRGRDLVESGVRFVLSEGRSQGWLDTKAGSSVENVRELLQRAGVVPGGVKFGVLLAIGFLLLCLVNASGLLLAKCFRRTQEIGVRRALGASRRDIILQFLVEALLLGLLSSAFGTLFALGGVRLTRMMPERYVQLADFSPDMLALVLIISVGVGTSAGLFPAWRAGRVEPAIQIKVD